MASEERKQSVSGISDRILLSLCLITACLQTITTRPGALGWEQGSHILLWVNLAVGYLLAMASVFPNDADTKVAAAKLSVFSAWLSVVLVTMVELSTTSP